MNAIELLTADHKKVKGLFEKAEELEGGKQKAVFDQIKKELETHTHIEETIFYPAVEKLQELKDMVRESLKEHNQVKTLLRELENLTPDDEEFAEKFEELMENVEHHVQEEWGEMFPLVKDQLDEQMLTRLGSLMMAEKARMGGQSARSASGS